MNITHHTSLLNALIKKYGYNSYLEIGVKNPANNFDLIECENKTGVDPVFIRKDILITTSDLFFDWNEKQFDLIFIDGDHTADQVKKDFENSLKCLTENGRIVIHDCLPELEETTCVPRGNQKVWFGDVYKFCMQLRNYDNIGFITYQFDCGCCVVWKDKTAFGDPTLGRTPDTSWVAYKQIGKVLMNVDETPI